MAKKSTCTWPVLALLLAAPLAQAGSLGPSACQSLAQAKYKRNATEVEMALISGSLNDVEVARARDGIQTRLRLDQASCSQQIEPVKRGASRKQARAMADSSDL